MTMQEQLDIFEAALGIAEETHTELPYTQVNRLIRTLKKLRKHKVFEDVKPGQLFKIKENTSDIYLLPENPYDMDNTRTCVNLSTGGSVTISNNYEVETYDYVTPKSLANYIRRNVVKSNGKLIDLPFGRSFIVYDISDEPALYVKCINPTVGYDLINISQGCVAKVLNQNIEVAIVPRYFNSDDDNISLFRDAADHLEEIFAEAE